MPEMSVNRIALFKRASAALWGARYRSDGARQLGISLRTMMRYDAGESPIPDEIMDKLTEFLNSRSDAMNRVSEPDRQGDWRDGGAVMTEADSQWPKATYCAKRK
jgi:hypothetical protein